MFLFQAERHVRPGIIAHLLNVLDVDYEILDINQREMKDIGWIDHTMLKKLESFHLVLLFINLPDRIYDRVRLLMRIMSAFVMEYGMYQQTVCRYVYEEYEPHKRKFICRSVAEQVVQRSAWLNNYYNGGHAYDQYSEMTIDNFINNWRIQFARLISYGYDDRQAL